MKRKYTPLMEKQKVINSIIFSLLQRPKNKTEIFMDSFPKDTVTEADYTKTSLKKKMKIRRPDKNRLIAWQTATRDIFTGLKDNGIITSVDDIEEYAPASPFGKGKGSYWQLNYEKFFTTIFDFERVYRHLNKNHDRSYTDSEERKNVRRISRRIVKNLTKNKNEIIDIFAVNSQGLNSILSIKTMNSIMNFLFLSEIIRYKKNQKCNKKFSDVFDYYSDVICDLMEEDVRDEGKKIESYVEALYTLKIFKNLEGRKMFFEKDLLEDMDNFYWSVMLPKYALRNFEKSKIGHKVKSFSDFIKYDNFISITPSLSIAWNIRGQLKKLLE